jgi:CAAX protease family protein
MTTLLDLLYVALFALALPLWDYLVAWPAFRRQSHADPARARRRLWSVAIGFAWALVVVGAALWVASDRSWTSFGFSVPEGWRLWTAIALFLLLTAYQVWAIVTLARSSDARASVRRQFGPLAAVVPHTRTELYWFGGVSLTAGFCEEFLYRGYFIWVFAPWLGWWGAAALSLPFFAVAHLYQGWNGVLRTAIVGAFLTLVVAICDSLWPAIALHALIDLGAGAMAWLALREGSANGEDASDPVARQLT